MNAKTIKAQLKNNNIDPQNFKIERAYHGYNVIYLNYGISDNLRQRMTGDQVNRKRQNDKEMLEKVAQVLGGEVVLSSVLVGNPRYI